MSQVVEMVDDKVNPCYANTMLIYIKYWSLYLFIIYILPIQIWESNCKTIDRLLI